jgi:hypothetical protein
VLKLRPLCLRMATHPSQWHQGHFRGRISNFGCIESQFLMFNHPSRCRWSVGKLAALRSPTSVRSSHHIPETSHSIYRYVMYVFEFLEAGLVYDV